MLEGSRLDPGRLTTGLLVALCAVLLSGVFCLLEAGEETLDAPQGFSLLEVELDELERRLDSCESKLRSLQASGEELASGEGLAMGAGGGAEPAPAPRE